MTDKDNQTLQLPVEPPEAILTIIGGYPWAHQGNNNKAIVLQRYERLRAYLASESGKLALSQKVSKPKAAFCKGD